MDENTNLEQQTADQPDAFAEGWDQPDELPETDQFSETAETGDTEGLETGEGQSAADQPDGEEAREQQERQDTVDQPGGAAAENPADQPGGIPAAAPVWTLKHMEQQISLPQNDPRIPAMLQKSFDYDRIREKYDEAKPVMEMFTEFAKAAGMNVQDYARYIRTEAKKAGGLNDADAKRAVELEDREARVAAQESEAAAARERQQAAQQAQLARQYRIRQDLEDFRRAFPEAHAKALTDRNAIPQEVWNEVNQGIPLTAAYARYAVAQAAAAQRAEQQRAETAQKNQQNAARSTGSMQSAGNSAKNTDAFLEGWESVE